MKNSGNFPLNGEQAGHCADGGLPLEIYFCFPYRGVGGVSLLFLRLAEHLTREGLARCHVVDYADGFMAKHLRQAGVVLEVYEDEGRIVRVPSGAIAVFQSMTPWSIFPGITLDSHARVFFWNCYPFNLIPLLPGLRAEMQHSEWLAKLVLASVLRGYRDKMRRLVRMMLAKKSLVFMDVPNVEVTERYLGLRIDDPEFVPIPLASRGDATLCPERDLSTKGLSVVWVGRVVDFKFYALHKCLVELNRLQPAMGVGIKVSLVGSGEYGPLLKKEAAKLQNIEFCFIDHIPPGELESFLLQSADLLIAMGTSALEGARLGIPTLLLDVAHAPVPDGYVFSWLHDRSGYTLGDIVRSERCTPGNNSLQMRVEELRQDFRGVSRKSFAYFDGNHEISKVANRFMSALQRSSCRYGDLVEHGMVGRGVLYALFAKLRKGLVRT